MPISSIKIDLATFNELGIGVAELPLEPAFEMRGLGQLVVLAGPNGSGKSRVLKLVRALLPRKLSPEGYLQNGEQILQEERGIKVWEQNIAIALELEQKGEPNQLRTDQRNLSLAQARLAGHKFTRTGSDAVSLTSSPIPDVIRFVPTNPSLIDPSTMTDHEATNRADQLFGRPEAAEVAAPAYARRVFRRATQKGYARLTSRESLSLPLTPEEQSRDRLRELVGQLLGQGFRVDVDDAKLLIGDVEPYSTVLSPGQQILFQFACMLHAREASLSNSIIMMDEPENHLHPAVLAEIVAILRTHLAGSQLWIATHSVPLIAQLVALDSNCLWYVDAGRVKHAGRSPELVIHSLMGGPNGAAELRNFTLLPAQYATARFLSECLEAPGVVGANIHDPQTRQITQILRSLAASRLAVGGRLRVLDFGAGKGRVLASLRDGDAHVSAWLDYYAFDIDDASKQECCAELSQTYSGDSTDRWFTDISLLESRAGRDFDVVVMCNVLHEIHPDEWIPLLAAQGALGRLLSPAGYLLIVEDYGIRIGERAHAYGFLLLDEQELCHLFEVASQDREERQFVRQTSGDPRYSNRLTAYLVGKSCVDRISAATRLEAIASLKRRMADIVRNLLRDDAARGAAAGEGYARSAQLLANATVWLETQGHTQTGPGPSV
jgi:energy-coupling factor transporter ATP-binding protein EcfA2/SAM-dependent methyltransferase